MLCMKTRDFWCLMCRNVYNWHIFWPTFICRLSRRVWSCHLMPGNFEAVQEINNIFSANIQIGVSYTIDYCAWNYCLLLSPFYFKWLKQSYLFEDNTILYSLHCFSGRTLQIYFRSDWLSMETIFWLSQRDRGLLVTKENWYC